MPTQPQAYADKLLAAKVITEAEVASIRDQVNTHFEAEFQASLSFTPQLKDTKDPKYRGSRAMTHKWQGMQFSQDGSEAVDTGYDTSKLTQIG